MNLAPCPYQLPRQILRIRRQYIPQKYSLRNQKTIASLLGATNSIIYMIHTTKLEHTPYIPYIAATPISHGKDVFRFGLDSHQV